MNLEEANVPEVLLEPGFLRRVEQLDIVSRRVFAGQIKGQRRSRRHGASVEFADYRDYSPGDEPRFIDWNIYGRLDRLFVKLFVEEEDLHVYLLMDASASMDFGEPSKFDVARKLCGALGTIGLTHFDRVAAFALSGDLDRAFALTRGRVAMWKLLRFLEETPARGPTALHRMAERFTQRFRRRGVVVLVSDFFDKAGYESALNLLVSQRYEVFAIQVLADEEVEPGIHGDVKLVDCEDGEYTEITASRALLSIYKRNLRNYTAALRDFCVRRGIGFLSTTTRVPFDELILRHLRRAGLVA